MALRKRQKLVVCSLNEQEWNDVLSAITFTQHKHPKDSPNFLKALEKLRVKMWGYYERQSKAWKSGEDSK